MEQLVLIVHVLVAIAIIGLILFQQGKGAGMGASFGAGASQTVFGSSGSGNALTRATSILATVFFITSFGLAVIAKNNANVGVDIPVPAVVESRDEEVPAEVTDLPELNEATVNEVLEGDIPVVEDSDLPVSSDDIPES